MEPVLPTTVRRRDKVRWARLLQEPILVLNRRRHRQSHARRQRRHRLRAFSRKTSQQVEGVRSGLPHGGDELADHGSRGGDAPPDPGDARLMSPTTDTGHALPHGGDELPDPGLHGGDAPPDPGDASLTCPTIDVGHALPHGSEELSDHDFERPTCSTASTYMDNTSPGPTHGKETLSDFGSKNLEPANQRPPRLQGGGGRPGDGDDLLEGLRQLFNVASHNSKPKKQQDGPLLQGVKSLIKKKDNDPDMDLFAGMRRLIEQEAKRRDKLRNPAQEWTTSAPVSSTASPTPRASSNPHNPAGNKGKNEALRSVKLEPRRTGAPVQQDKWHEVKWLPRVSDWSHDLTDNLALSRGPEQFASNLEQDQGEAHIVYVESETDFNEVVALAQAERNPMVQVIMLSNIHLEDPSALRCRVPGTFRGSLQSRSCWCP